MKIYRGDIYMARLDAIGSEQAGERPVLILQNNIGNACSPTTIVAPITSKVIKKKYMSTHVKIECRGLDKESMVLLEQIRTIDRKRLKGKLIAHLNKRSMLAVDQALAYSLDIDIGNDGGVTNE